MKNFNWGGVSVIPRMQLWEFLIIFLNVEKLMNE